MSFIRFEFSHDNKLMAASFQVDDHLTPTSSDVKIGIIDGKAFLNKFYKKEPITLKDKQGEIFQISIDEILNCFIDDEDQILYLIFNKSDNLCAVWKYYDEEEVYRRYRVYDIYTIRKFEMLIAAEDNLRIDALSLINNFNTISISGSEILDCYKSIDDDSDDESKFGESKSVPPSFCPHPGMCSNYEDDPDMCDKCGGF